MKHSSVYFLKTVLLGALSTVFLSGCVSLYLQDDSAKSPEHFKHQDLIAKRFESNFSIKVFKLRSNFEDALPLHGLPLAVVIEGQSKPNDIIYYDPDPIMTLPSGTVLEMVGEMAWKSSAVNAQPPQNFDYFIVHDIGAADDLLLPLSRSRIQTSFALKEEKSRPLYHSSVSSPVPFLIEVDAISQWTCARYNKINTAQWHKGVDLKMSRRVTRPSCDLATTLERKKCSC